MTFQPPESRGDFARDAFTPDGIAFGSTASMLPYVARQRDRREPFSGLLASLTRALDRRLDVSLMRGAFETALGRIVPVRSIHLREVGSRWSGRHDQPGAESVVLE